MIGGGFHGAGGGRGSHGAGGGHGFNKAGGGGSLGGAGGGGNVDAAHPLHHSTGAGYGYYGYGGYWGYGGYGYYGFIPASPAIFAGQTVAQALTDFANNPNNALISVVDSAANVAGGLDGLQGIAAGGELSSIALSDSGVPTVSIAAGQLATDAAALASITGYFTVSATAPTTSATLAGAPNALGNTLVFSGDAGQYSFTPSGDGVHLAVAGNGVTDQLSDIQALQFADFKVIVANTPGQGSATSGNIAELYAAAFAREPDVAGLAYYENVLQSNPATPLQTFAQWFLASGEYTSNPAHNYAVSSAGDAQFITDSFENLLHRAPSTTDLAYYQNGVMAAEETGLTPGTSAFANAQSLAHAIFLADLSASQEFLTDVQITGTHPADASHWLLLI